MRASRNYCSPQDAIFKRHGTVFCCVGFFMKLVLSSNQLLYETVASIVLRQGRPVPIFTFFQFGSLMTLSDAV